MTKILPLLIAIAILIAAPAICSFFPDYPCQRPEWNSAVGDGDSTLSCPNDAGAKE